MKILIIRFSSIGDIVLTTPVIRCIKKQVPGVEVHFLMKKPYESVLQHNPYIDKKHFFEDDYRKIVVELKKEKFDLIIDLQKNFRSLKIKRSLGVKSFSFNKLNIQKWILVNFKINILPKVHIVDRYMETVKSLGVINDGEGLDYFISSEDERVISELPETHRKNFIGWVIGAKHNTKMLPMEKLISIGQKIKSPIVLLGGKYDFERGEKLAETDRLKFFNACGKFTLNQSAALVKHASKIITHDTGLMHIAAAFNKPIISIWGNTVPEFGMTPYTVQSPESGVRNESVILEVRGLSCRPCSKIGFEKCPRGHFKCMLNQDEDVFYNLID
jgi:ADP-heptose:LPS heptosyltransferase